MMTKTIPDTGNMTPPCLLAGHEDSIAELPRPIGARSLMSLVNVREGTGRKLRRLNWSGRRDLNPRPSAWEATALPLSYSRSAIGLYMMWFTTSPPDYCAVFVDY